MNEAAFLAAIRDNPHDRATRLVYADWLEERDDPRGALIRIEEEMRDLPAFADRFWQLKPRRNELRARAPAEWREVLGYGTDCLPVFGHGIPEGWKERWRLIREFAERWDGIPLGDVSGRTEKVREVEARLGRALPPSVREWVALARDGGRGTDPYFLFGNTFEMREIEGQSAVSLWVQTQGNYYWGIRHGDFALADPPVYGYYGPEPDETGDGTGFVPDEGNPVAPTLTAFALDSIINTLGKGGGFWAQVAGQGGLIRELERRFPVRSRFGEADLLEGDNILVRVLSPMPHFPWKEIFVKVAKSMPREAFPAFFWEYARYVDGRVVSLYDYVPF